MSLSLPRSLLRADSPCVCLAAEQSGFLHDILEENDRIKQMVTPLASQDYLTKLVFCECTAVSRRTDSGARVNAVESSGNEFKRALQALAITLCGASGASHTVFVKWRSSENTAVSTSTTFNIGFNPPELKEAFVTKARAKMNTLVGLSLLDHELQVSDIVTQQGFKFYANVPPGFTDETLLAAMISEGGLDHDHVLAFGYDVNRRSACNSPSGDLFFYFAPAGCRDHGSTEIDDTSLTDEPLISILQPPSSFFVTLPNGSEHHIKVRKAGACQSCWQTPARLHLQGSLQDVPRRQQRHGRER
jgi:hypothetical protein